MSNRRGRRAWPGWRPRTGAVLLGVGLLIGSSEASSDSVGCWAGFEPGAALGSARPDTGAQVVLESARRFGGDSRVGRLRWARALATTSEIKLGPVRNGVIPISGATATVTDPDYGYPIAVKDALGVLRAGDGRTLWSRSGTGAGVSPVNAADPYDLSTAQTFDARTNTHRTGTFDLTTGRGRWCADWRKDALTAPFSAEKGGFVAGGDGTVLIPGRAVAKVRAHDGGRLWSTAPAELPYRQVIQGDGVVVASTDSGDDVGGIGSAEPLSELAAFRSSDGRLLWRIADRSPADDRALVRQWALTERRILGSAAGRVMVAEAPGGVPRGPDRDEYLPEAGRLTAYGLADGRPRWSRSFAIGPKGARPNVIVAGSRVLVGDPDGRMIALRAGDGSREWSRSVGEVPRLGNGALDGRYLYALGPDGRLRVIDLRDGDMTYVLKTLPPLRGTIAIGVGTLVLQADNLVLAFDLRTA